MLTHPYSIDLLLADLQILKPSVACDPLWAFNEFSAADFNDLRVTRRCQLLARNFENQPPASIPQSCGDWPGSKAAYRFFSNPKVSLAAILAAHSQRTIQRLGCGRCPVILCPQDTTGINYSHLLTPGLGPVGTTPGKSLGLLLHSTLALSPEGQFAGLLEAQCWARPNRKKSRRARSRREKKIHEKESARWLKSFLRIDQLAHQHPAQQWVSVGDRESDIYELLRAATAPEALARLLVRARHDRPLTGIKRTLFQHLRRLDPAGTCVVQVPRHHDQPARQATLRIGFDRVSLRAPAYHKGQGSISLWAVWAQEINQPADCKPIAWCLLTTASVGNLTQAVERIQWYVKRWIIEEFHRVLKSGCQTQARQLCTGQRLQRVLALDMVVAWRIMEINKAARLEPDSPADRWFSTEEWQALYCYVNQCAGAPQEPPSISQMVGWLAQLGGFLGRKSDGQPGNTTLWRGLQRLKDITAAWRAFGPEQRPERIKGRRKKKSKTCG